MNPSERLRRLATWTLIGGLWSSAVAAQGTLIAVPDRRDHAWDSARELLYISTSDGFLERYDPQTGQLLTPFDIGNEINGIDLQSGASILYAAEGVEGPTQGIVRKVDLVTGGVVNLVYDLDSLEGGAWDVGITSEDIGFVSTSFNGSGWVPFRQLDLATDSLTPRIDTPGSGGGGDVRQNTRIFRSPGAFRFFMTEANISSGPCFTYDRGLDGFPVSVNKNTFLGNVLAAVDDQGNVAMEFGANIALLDAALNTIDVITSADAGVAFHPFIIHLLFAGDSTSDEVVAFDIATLDELDRLPIGEDLPGSTAAFDSGEMTISSNGRYLFVSTPMGVRQITQPFVFFDGFESGDTTLWSDTVP